MLRTRLGYIAFYTIFVIAFLLYGDLFLAGPISLRHIMTFMIFSYILLKEKKLYIDRFVVLYFAFASCYLMCSVLTGHTGDGLKKFIGYYFVCYVTYWSTLICVRQYRGLMYICYLILALGFFDSLMSIGQVIRLPQVETIATVLHFNADMEYLELSQDRTDFGMKFFIPGIMGVVYNGYWLMFVCILSTILQKRGFSILGLIYFVIAIIGCFIVQERSSFIVALLFSLYLYVAYIISSINKKFKYIVFFVIAIFMVYSLFYAYDIMMDSEVRFAETGTSLTGRDYIWKRSIDFVINNPFVPGYERFNSSYKLHPHNLILNAFIYSGLIGFTFFMILLINQFLVIGPYFLKKITRNNIIIVALSFSYLGFTINAMVHNSSLVTGDATLWLIWGCIYPLYQDEKEKNQQLIAINK